MQNCIDSRNDCPLKSKSVRNTINENENSCEKGE